MVNCFTMIAIHDPARNFHDHPAMSDVYDVVFPDARPARAPRSPSLEDGEIPEPDPQHLPRRAPADYRHRKRRRDDSASSEADDYDPLLIENDPEHKHSPRAPTLVPPQLALPEVASRISPSFALWQQKKDGAYILHSAELEDADFQELLAQNLTALTDQFGNGNGASKIPLADLRERIRAHKGSSATVTMSNIALYKTREAFHMSVSLLASLCDGTIPPTTSHISILASQFQVLFYHVLACSEFISSHEPLLPRTVFLDLFLPLTSFLLLALITLGHAPPHIRRFHQILSHVPWSRCLDISLSEHRPCIYLIVHPWLDYNYIGSTFVHHSARMYSHFSKCVSILKLSPKACKRSCPHLRFDHTMAAHGWFLFCCIPFHSPPVLSLTEPSIRRLEKSYIHLSQPNNNRALPHSPARFNIDMSRLSSSSTNSCSTFSCFFAPLHLAFDTILFNARNNGILNLAVVHSHGIINLSSRKKLNLFGSSTIIAPIEPPRLFRSFLDDSSLSSLPSTFVINIVFKPHRSSFIRLFGMNRALVKDQLNATNRVDLIVLLLHASRIRTDSSYWTWIIRTMLYNRFKFKGFPNLCLNAPFHPLIQRGATVSSLSSLINATALPESIHHKLISSSRVSLSNHRSIKDVLCNHRWFAKHVHLPVKCLCNSSSSDPADHTITTGSIFDATTQFVLSINADSSPFPSSLVSGLSLLVGLLWFCYCLLLFIDPSFSRPTKSSIVSLADTAVLEALAVVLSLLSAPSRFLANFITSAWGPKSSTSDRASSWFTSDMLSRARTSLRGWIVFPLDHNNGKLVALCPVLARHRLSLLFPVKVSYRAWPFLSCSHSSNYQRLHDSFASTCVTFRRFMSSLPAHLRKLCKTPTKASFQCYAFGQPKQTDFSRFRPLVSYACHPFKRLLNFCSRALLLILTLSCATHWSLLNETLLPSTLASAFESINSLYDENTSFLFFSADIKNMFSCLPHPDIIEAIIWLISRFRSITNKSGVWISAHSASLHKDDPSAIFLSLDVILTICIFDIRHAIFFFGIVLLLQILGIPMGSPVSPQLAIITCAYSEHKWSIAHLSWSSHLASVRFVDDLGIILAYNSCDQNSFNLVINILRSIVNTCYPPGLELKFILSPRVLTLMRCSFSVSADRLLQYCYVNKNKHSLLLASPSQTFIRYRHFFSFFPVHKMSNTASATLTSIVKFSSSPASAYNSSVELITELRLLMYPWGLLQSLLHRRNKAEPSLIWTQLISYCHLSS
jgi:hypothetical protein